MKLLYTHLLTIALALAALMSCTSQSPVRPERAPLPDPDNVVLPVRPNATPRQRIVDIAMGEWHRWGEQTVRLNLDGRSCVTTSALPPPELITEQSSDDLSGEANSEFCPGFPDGTGVEATPEGCAMAKSYWRIVGKEPNCQQITTGQWAWSATFISWVMRKAGLDQSQFLTGEAHSQYIVDARDHILPSPAFEVVALPAIPKVGDMLCAVRGDAYQHITEPDEINFGATPMHCDIVVSIDSADHTLKAIGGNVQQSVTMSTIDTDENGMIRRDEESNRPWVLIMRNKLP